MTETKVVQMVIARLEGTKTIHSDIGKRLLDMIAASIVLCVFAPIMLIVAILIKTTSKGPILFTQTRMGYRGQPFKIYKFRTMRTDMNDDIHRAFMQKIIKKQTEKGVAVFKMANDPRITWVGKFLRKTSLDELPQLFNVLIGTMSIVGPRPPLAYEVEHYESWQLARLNALPGITGLWQVSGRNHTDFNTMVQQDIEYIKKRNVWMDVSIMIKTPVAMLQGY